MRDSADLQKALDQQNQRNEFATGVRLQQPLPDEDAQRSLDEIQKSQPFRATLRALGLLQ